jgi:hypothetical protein
MPTTLHCFWHGSQLGPYQLVGLRSFVDQGHRVELYTYANPDIEVPDWITRRDADEIWPADRVLSYQHGIGKGSFALHANLFGYAFLLKIGGWWIDLDVVLLRPQLPQQEIFFSMESYDPVKATFSVLKFPRGHPAIKEALARCVELGETPLYGVTGADLLTEMVVKHDLVKFGQPMELTFPISALEVPVLFDPMQYGPLLKKCSDSIFLHLFNETWRRAGIPRYLGPPEGSYIDHLLTKHGLPALSPRMEFEDVKRWTAYLTLHEEYQAGQRAFRVSNDALRSRVDALERENAELRSFSLQSRSRSDINLLRRVLGKFARTFRP